MRLSELVNIDIKDIDFSEEKKSSVVDKVILNDGSMGNVSTLADFCHYSATHPAELEDELGIE